MSLDPKFPTFTHPMWHKGNQLDLYPNQPPTLKLSYKYTLPFDQVVSGMFNKYSWEPNGQHTSISDVQQLDDDTFQFVRRQDHLTHSRLSYEVVTVDRSGKTVSSKLI